MRTWSLIGVAVVFLLSGCQEAAKHSKFVRRDFLYRSAVSLSPGTTELVVGKIPNVALIGRTASCNYPTTVNAIPVVMNGVKPNYEKIIALKPGVVVYDPNLFSKEDLSKFEAAKIPTFGIGESTLKQFIVRLFEMGADFSVETAIMTYVGDIERAQVAAETSAPKVKPTLVFLMPDPNGRHMIAGTETFLADIGRICGAEVLGPKSSRFEMASVESLVSWNPDKIICSPNFESIVNDSRLQSMSAIKNIKMGKPTVAQINGDLLLRQGSRVDLLIKNVSTFISGANHSE